MRLENIKLMANRLVNETSPYLLQHATNPVDWYAWGTEALSRAKTTDKPILLSIGYSACHWCHVMEKESFEDQNIAELMNEHFVNIKVDREERPDLDSIYMTAIQLMTGHGGWPMTVFLTPNCEPFYGGTYFPPTDRQGLIGFPRLLKSIAETYNERRDDVSKVTKHLMSRLETMSSTIRSDSTLTQDIITKAYENLVPNFDAQHGGFGQQPKFPQPMIYEFILRHFARTETSLDLEIIELTLDRMAEGGIYDQLGGGFHRYSTDQHWIVPHFEKMLYDNALLVSLYLHGYQITKNPAYRRIVEETLEYVTREMTDDCGGFYSSQDADSEGVEGKYFVWEKDEILDVLGNDDGEIINDYYGITRKGNFEGSNILRVEKDEFKVRKKFNLSKQDFDAILRRSKIKLLEYRSDRIPPSRDSKILTSWNALMLRAFANASSILERSEYREIAKLNARFLLDNLRRNGRLLRTYKNGQSKLGGYLEDYAFLIDGLLALHEVTFETEWLEESISLADQMVDLFWDDNSNQLYDTGKDQENLIIRPCELTDNAIPCGSSVAAEVLLRLSIITNNAEYKHKAITLLSAAQGMMSSFPASTGQWLNVLDAYLNGTKEIVLAGNPLANDTQKLLSALYENYIPSYVLVGIKEPKESILNLPITENREQINAVATAFVCENYVCQMPTTDATQFSIELQN